MVYYVESQGKERIYILSTGSSGANNEGCSTNVLVGGGILFTKEN